MDPLFSYSNSVPRSASLEAQAQQLLQSLGWVYYTIWRKTTGQTNPLFSQFAPGLIWSQGDVNRSLLLSDQKFNTSATTSELDAYRAPTEIQQMRSKAYKMGYLLQQFYKSCSFLPFGLGIAGVVMASGRYQWATSGEELSKQISFLSSYNQRLIPQDLQERFFETIVCIPLQNGAGVLEMGTTTLVPESEAMLQWLSSMFDGPVATREPEGVILDPVLKSGFVQHKIASFRAGTSVGHGELEEHNLDTIKAMMYGGRSIRQSNLSSSFCSAASSPRSADHQKGTTALLNLPPVLSMSDEDVYTNSSVDPSLHATSFAMPNNNSIHLGQMGLQSTGTSEPPFFIPTFGYQQLTPNADIHRRAAASHIISHDDFGSSNRDLYCSSTHVTLSSLLPSAPSSQQNDTHYNQQQSYLQCSNPQQNQRYKRKMTDSSSGELPTQHAVTAFPNRILPSAPVAETLSRRACKDKEREMPVKAATIDADSSTSAPSLHTTRNKNPVFHDMSDTAGGLYAASILAPTISAFYDRGPQLVVGFSSTTLAKSTVTGSVYDQYAAGSDAARVDDQHTSTNMQLQLQGCTDGSPDDHDTRMQQYAAKGSAARPGALTTYGTAFKSWRKPLHLVSSQKKQTQTGTRGSILKKLLLHFLPKTKRESTVWLEHEIKARPPGSLIGYVQDMKRTSSLLNSIMQGKDQALETAASEEAAVNHMHAERNRRRKQAECYQALRNLVPHTVKKDKVALLEHSIQHLKELKNRISQLDEERANLLPIVNEENQDSLKSSVTITGSEASATCLCIPYSTFEDSNFFHLTIHKLSIKDEDINSINIGILDALQKKNLHCTKFKSRFEKSTRKVDIIILARYKVSMQDGMKCTLSMDGIQEIKEWWPKFVKNFEMDKLL